MIARAILFFLFLKSGLVADGCRCGVENVRTRIIDGHAAQRDRYPWMASVLIQSGSSMASCGGSLINDRYILTAAHCMKGAKDVRSLRITLGAHTASERQTKAGVEAEKIVSHPEWKGHNDIALIRLKEPVTDVPVCLASFTSYDNLFVTGWGMTGKTGNSLLSRAEELMEVDVKEVEVMECKRKHFPQVNVEKEICAGGDKGGSCMGDSGGPLQTRKNGLVYQVGIVSFGATDCSTLSKAPNVYERVTGQLDWIRENTKDAKYCHAPEQAIAGTKSPNQVSIPPLRPLPAKTPTSGGKIPTSEGKTPTSEGKTPTSEGKIPKGIPAPGSGLRPIPVGTGTMRPIVSTPVFKPIRPSFEFKPTRPSFEFKPIRPSFEFKPTRPSFEFKPTRPSFEFKPTRPRFELGSPTFIVGSGFNPVQSKTSGQWTVILRPVGGSSSDPLKRLEDMMEQSRLKPLFPTGTTSPMTRVVLSFPTSSASTTG